MKRIRQDIRLTKEEKMLLENQAKDQGMTMTEYMKNKLFYQNSDFVKDEYIYHCPSGEHYNYAMAGLSMTNYLLLEAVIKHLYKSESSNVMKVALSKSMDNLENFYNYTRTEVKKDE